MSPSTDMYESQVLAAQTLLFAETGRRGPRPRGRRSRQPHSRGPTPPLAAHFANRPMSCRPNTAAAPRHHLRREIRYILPI